MTRGPRFLHLCRQLRISEVDCRADEDSPPLVAQRERGREETTNSISPLGVCSGIWSMDSLGRKATRSKASRMMVMLSDRSDETKQLSNEAVHGQERGEGTRLCIIRDKRCADIDSTSRRDAQWRRWMQCRR